MIETAKTRKRIVVIGLGDTGVLVATGLSKQFDVTAVTPRPFYLNSQNLGARLAWPDFWEGVAKISTDRFARLDPVRIVQGLATQVDLQRDTVTVNRVDGSKTVLAYDALVIASGAENGFWRRTLVETWQEEAQRRQDERAPLKRASSIAIIGGGASGVSSAAGLAERYPDKSVRLFFSGKTVLPEFPRRAALTMMKRLKTLGVECHPNHRAVRPKPEDMRVIKPGRVAWQNGQAPVQVDAIIWALGKQTPNSNYLPNDILDDAGFVRVRPTLQIEASDHVFCVGDLAAS
ncbi:MAG: FAD-dependent oxidoreductase, partial [Pseudomonadota bacterium]